jgi:6-pyruvoyltetrahydropterin/6-carboxytetrahydropterin synthase
MSFKVIVNNNRVKFSASHFLKEPFKCSRLHGHNYYVSVEIESQLDDNYFVVDFIELKKSLEKVVKPLDHSFLLPSLSKELVIINHEDSVEITTKNDKKYVFPKSDVVFLPIPATTSELLAKYIHEKLKSIYTNKIITVKLEESKSNIAVYQE